MGWRKPQRFLTFEELEPGNYLCAEDRLHDTRDFYGPIEWLQITYCELRDTGGDNNDVLALYVPSTWLVIGHDGKSRQYTDLYMVTAD